MTEDFKEKLYRYITGQLNIESENTDEVILEKESISAENNPFLPYKPDDMNLNNVSDIISTNTDISIIYGSYTTTQNEARGFIILLDVNFNPIKCITQFSSGTNLRAIVSLKQLEDNTFIMVDSVGYTGISDNNRFVILNNFTLKDELTNDYIIKLRTSYNIPYTRFDVEEIYKNPNSSQYVMTGTNLGDDYLSYFGCIELKVNVGESNEWHLYVSNYQTDFENNCYVEFNNNEQYLIKVIVNLFTSNVIALIQKPYNSNSFSSTTLYNTGVLPTMNNKSCVAWINSTLAYFTFYDSSNIYMMKYNNGTVSTIFNAPQYSAKRLIFIKENNGEIYIVYRDNVDTVSETADYFFQRLENDEWNPTFIVNSSIYDRTKMLIKSIYNLLEVLISGNLIFSQNYLLYCTIKEDYNSNNYNSTPYENYNSLTSEKGRLYSNNHLIFARNLYNKLINKKTTSSIISIPNSYLNDIDITNQQLISETNNIMISNNNTINKNIYEEVLINFNNTIETIDTTTNEYFDNASIMVNNSINVGTETSYNNTYIGKYRINYDNQPSETNNISITNINKTTGKIEFTLYIDASINSIDILSNDETTIYDTINTNMLEVGKTYTITQYVRTGEEPTPNTI